MNPEDQQFLREVIREVERSRRPTVAIWIVIVAGLIVWALAAWKIKELIWG